MTKEYRTARIDDQEFGTDSLVGSYFHSDAQRGWQGIVVAEPHPGVYLVETFSWVMGESHDQRLVRVEDMLDWRFYDTADWMNNAYEGGVWEASDDVVDDVVEENFLEKMRAQLPPLPPERCGWYPHEYVRLMGRVPPHYKKRIEEQRRAVEEWERKYGK